VTAEGLRIELLESAKGTFFESGSSRLNESGKEMLVLLAQDLSSVPNHVSIEGHTDAKPYGERANYSNWELSADRANAARRIMQQAGLRRDQVSQVRGFADSVCATPPIPSMPRTDESRSSSSTLRCPQTRTKNPPSPTAKPEVQAPNPALKHPSKMPWTKKRTKNKADHSWRQPEKMRIA
jgi:chemotaxis protein MotB